MLFDFMFRGIFFWYDFFMRYIFTNPNPNKILIGDCAVRAVAIALGITWDKAYEKLTEYGFKLKNLPNADSVWGAVLKDEGFERNVIPNICPNCYTVRDFCRNHPKGTYVLATGTHVVAVIDGNYYDTWDSGDEVPVMFWRKYGIL